jgi:hypothetical protein
MELWNYGIMELWNYGIMELWNYGIMESSTIWTVNGNVFLESPIENRVFECRNC